MPHYPGEALARRLVDLPTAQLIEIARRCKANRADWQDNAIIFHRALRVLLSRLSQDAFLELCKALDLASPNRTWRQADDATDVTAPSR